MDDDRVKWRFTAVTIAALGALWAETIAALIALPASIPTSFNTAGVPQAFGSKFMLLIFPVIGLGVFFITQLAQNGPIRVTGVTIPPEREDAVNAVGRWYMAIVRAELLVGFACIQLTVILSAQSQALSALFGVVIALFPLVLVSTIALMIVKIASAARR